MTIVDEIKQFKEKIASLTQENEVLRAENAQLRLELDEYKTKNEKMEKHLTTLIKRVDELEKNRPGAMKNARKKKEKATTRKKRAQEQNNSRRRMSPTRTIVCQINQCPDCHSNLYRKSISYTRQLIDIPEPQPVEVTEYEVWRGRCPSCQCWRTAPLPELAAPASSRFGNNVHALVATLRTKNRLPISQIKEYLSEVHQLELSKGELVEMLATVAAAGAQTLEQIKEIATGSAVLHADETGWHQAGERGYIWALSVSGRRGVRFYHYVKSRRGEVIQGLLAGKFKGCLVTDFYAPYGRYNGRHQRCWAHLLRDLEDLVCKNPENEEVRIWVKVIIELYIDSVGALREDAGISVDERLVFYERVKKRLHDFSLLYASAKKHPLGTLSKRLLRFEDELFEFLRDTDVPATNNEAERTVRPLVIGRKISGGTRSERGSQIRMDLQSLFATWQVRGLAGMATCLRLLRGEDTLILSASP
jgi:transposase